MNDSNITDDRIYDEDGNELCPECRHPLQAIWENVGFTEPEGPSKMEIVGVECPNCGYKD